MDAENEQKYCIEDFALRKTLFLHWLFKVKLFIENNFKYHV